jgi:thioredoxin
LPVGVTTAPLELTDGNIAEVLRDAGTRPVLVDCWAPWCGPCRMIAPSIEALSAESTGRYVVGKLNVDHNPRTAGQHNISSIPTVLIFKSGALVDRIVGLQPKTAIAARLLSHL